MFYFGKELAVGFDRRGAAKMVHTIRTSVRSEDVPYFRRISSLLFAPDVDLGSKLERLFVVEAGEFDMDHAFFSRVDRSARTQHFEVVHGPGESLEAGKSVPLSRTYCRKTIEQPDGTMVVDDAQAEGWSDDPAYTTFGLGSYVGTTVNTEDELYGTLCFANSDSRDEPIAQQEKALVEMYGQWATNELNRWTTGPSSDTTDDADSGDPVAVQLPEYGGESPSSRINSMMELLARRPRRLVLFHLLRVPSNDGADVLDETAKTEQARIEMNHLHLPKLEAMGYVEWDRDSNTVTRGPRFDEIVPVLGLLRDYAGEV